jgi:hypothetical protein
MTHVDSEVCKRVCPFSDKKRNGICSIALHKRLPKDKVCVSNVSIRIEKKKDVKL